MTDSGDVTRLLAELAGDGQGAMDRVFPLVYDELHRVAHRQLQSERPDHTLDTTALVHEAYLRLAGAEDVEWRSRAHFFAVAARAMRRILINHAHARNAQKQGGGWRRVQLADQAATPAEDGETLLALDRALSKLAKLDERQCRVVECRYFAGMSIEETAAGQAVAEMTGVVWIRSYVSDAEGKIYCEYERGGRPARRRCAACTRTARPLSRVERRSRPSASSRLAS